MSFAEPNRSYSETRKRTSNNYVKFDPKYRLILRILNPKARTSWKHWIGEANAGRGLMATCPNTAQNKICPIDKSLEGLDKTDPTYLERRAKKRFLVNVLDRTPYTVCSTCNEKTPGKKCVACGADVSKKHEFVPLNQVKLLEHGPALFATALNAIEESQRDDFGVDITGYDISFTTTGANREKKIAPLPAGAPYELSEKDFLDPETGEPQRLFDLDLLAEPSTVDEIDAMLKGATVQDLNQLRGIE